MRRLAVSDALKEIAASTGLKSGHASKGRMVIMAGQVAIACTLLIGAALLGRSFFAMIYADRGFDPANVLTARVAMPDFAFTPQQRLEVLERLMERTRALPASRIAFTTGLPLINSETIAGFTMKSVRPPLGVDVQVHTVRSVVTEDYFEAIGMKIIQGRSFNETDGASSRTAVVNRTFANRYLSERAVGDRISNFATDDHREFEVIGIVEDVLKRSVTTPPQPEIYSLDRQMDAGTFNPHMGSLVLRTENDLRALIDPLKQIVAETHPSLALESIMTMEDRVSGSLSRPRFYAILLGLFAACSVLIAGVGLFGVLSYTVAQRTREIAVRIAIGAKPMDVMTLVLRQGMIVTATGLAIGVGISLAFIEYLSTLLYGVTAYDWATFTGVPLAIAITAIVACIAPAVRAARIDPLAAMKEAGG
jgi:predicted permease